VKIRKNPASIPSTPSTIRRTIDEREIRVLSMTEVTDNEQKVLRLGELLTQAGIVQSQELSEAVQTSNETGLPIGRVLIMSGYLTDQELQAAVQAQSLMRDRVIELDVALKALQSVSQEGLTLEQALKVLGWVNKRATSTATLGEFLISSELCSQDQLDEAVRTSQETGLPLGRVLVLIQAVSDELLTAALTAQVLVRDGKITKEEAIQALASARRRRVTIEVSLADHGFYKAPIRQSIKLGELLVLAGILNESDLMTALELGLARGMPVGQVLVQTGQMTRAGLDAALKVQDMVSEGTLHALQAAEALRQVVLKNISIAQAVAELGLLKSDPSETIRLGEILQSAGILTDDDIQKAIELSTKNSALVGKMLLVSGMIDEGMLHSALRCQFLLREGFLKMEQAVVALNHSQKHRVSFDDALQQLGWTLRSRPK